MTNVEMDIATTSIDCSAWYLETYKDRPSYCRGRDNMRAIMYRMIAWLNEPEVDLTYNY